MEEVSLHKIWHHMDEVMARIKCNNMVHLMEEVNHNMEEVITNMGEGMLTELGQVESCQIPLHH